MATQNTISEKYRSYQSQSHAVFTITLSTYVKSASFASSDRMRHFWDHHFIYRVKCCLPVRAKIDHDWVLELSPGGAYHYHGFLAVEGEYQTRVCGLDGLPRSKLKRALDSFSVAGKYRPFRVNKYLIEPATNVAAWSGYITKQNQPFV